MWGGEEDSGTPSPEVGANALFSPRCIAMEFATWKQQAHPGRRLQRAGQSLQQTLHAMQRFLLQHPIIPLPSITNRARSQQEASLGARFSRLMSCDAQKNPRGFGNYRLVQDPGSW